jgi:hypothetical protein
MTVIGVGVGAPLGLFAGTYLAEYGRHDKLLGDPVSSTTSAERTLDHHRPVHLWRGVF